MILAVAAFIPTAARGNDWEPISGAGTLREFMSGLSVERDLPGKEVARGEYHADGTGVLHQWGAIGVLATHQWDVAGESSFSTSLTGGQYFYTFNLTGGWQISAGPNWSHTHKADSGDAWTLPLGIGVAKTSVLGGLPWKGRG